MFSSFTHFNSASLHIIAEVHGCMRLNFVSVRLSVSLGVCKYSHSASNRCYSATLLSVRVLFLSFASFVTLCYYVSATGDKSGSPLLLLKF